MGSTIWYVESSALVAALIEQDEAVRTTLRAPGRRVTSALTLAEARRAVVRARQQGRLDADLADHVEAALRLFERRTEIVAVREDVLSRAGRPFPVEPIRTLDAIHLATAELLGDLPRLVTVLTRDARVRENALALGFAVA